MHKVLILVLAGIVAAFQPAVARPQKWRVSDPAEAAELRSQGARVLANYGSFELLETDTAPASPGQLKHAENEDEMDFIELNAKRLDTRGAEVTALRKSAGRFSGKRLHLLQFVGPIKPEWREELERTGIRVAGYVPSNAYIVFGDETALANLQAWAGTNRVVQWEGAYADDYKIHPEARLVDAQGNPRTPATDTFTVQMLADPEANAATLALIDQLKLGPVNQQWETLQYLNVVVALPAQRLAELAARPEVISIQPQPERHRTDERQDQILAGNLSGSAPSGPGYLAWLAGKGFSQAQFTSSGVVVDMSDSGIDNGTTAPGHFGLYQGGIPSLGSRVAYTRLVGTPNSGSTVQGCDGHGNLNSHIVAGYNDRATGFPHTDSAGYHYGLGVCPFVMVGSSVVFDPNNFTSPNYPSLQSQAYRDGARVSNNSWGANTAGAYTADSQSYDALVRDAQPAGSTVPVAGNQQMVIVFAAGNAGPSAGTVGSPGTAKNVLVVGAAENVRSLSTADGGNNTAGNDGCSTPDTSADSANDIASFSSRGPCSDGRQKPDIVGPGTHVTGGVGQSVLTTNGNGTAISCFVASGVCALPGGGTVGNANNFFPLGQQWYTTSSGTSHSTPAVSGASALLRQYFINQGWTAPSPAMTKAFLVNSARYMTGVYAGDTLPSPSQGMGALNLGTAFDGVTRVLHDQSSTDKFTGTGQTRTINGSIVDSGRPFRVTLAWTDAPGSTTGNAYNNNLDLTVTVGGNTYKGNVFSGGVSVTGGTADAKNNLESVFLPAGVSGSFTVTVTAVNINSDGVPNEAPTTDQDYALVVYNGTDVVAPIITPQPQSQTVSLGSPATFLSGATGQGPFGYQWYFGGSVVSGGTSSSYTINSAGTGDAGSYYMVATNIIGRATSAVATLTVVVAPLIQSDPASLTVVTGSTAGFSIAALGAPSLGYQWQFNGAAISGATASAYAIASAQVSNQGLYSAVVRNYAGSVTSAMATLTVYTQLVSYTGVLAGWDVSGLTSYGPSPLTPTTTAGNVTVVGLTRGSGVATGGTAAAGAWGGSGFNASTLAAATSAGDYATFSVSANAGCQVSFSTISRFDYRRSNSGPPTGVWQYQVGTGAFNSFITNSYSTGSSGGSLGPIGLSGIGDLQNVGAGTNVTFRIVNYAASSSGGNWYVYNVLGTTASDLELQGTVASLSAPVSAAPVLALAGKVGNQFQFTLLGTVGSNYVVEASTNLVTGAWTPVRTNSAPMVFIQPATNGQQYYRGKVLR